MSVADLGEITRAIGDEYLRVRSTTPFQRKALRAMQRCRTEAMGSVRGVCDSCGAEHLMFRSCRNRNCPRCQAQCRAAWLEAREKELLPVPYFHVVFTVPEMLNAIALYCPEVFYAALMRAAGHALLDVGRTKLGAELGCLTVLHTWGQNLSLHPHVHCVVPGGGISLDGQRWVAVRKSSYLLPIKVLSRRFRTLVCESLREAAREGRLERASVVVPLYSTIEGAAAQEWIAYAKQPFGGPEQVLAYLSRYTHRVAISNHRILLFADKKVTFAWRDYADDHRVKHMRLDAFEFLRRFLMHVLPDRFVRIRYFGFMANRQRASNIARVRDLIGCRAAVRPARRIAPRVLCPACQAAAAQPFIAKRGRGGAVRPPPVGRSAA